MNPEKPSSVPAIINTLLPNTKPVAADANPAYELSSDITTGMSADSANMKSTLFRAVSSLMNFGCLPFSVSTILSSPYS